MDLRFSKTKIELIKEIEACEDETLLSVYLNDLKERKSEAVSSRFPQTIEGYRNGIKESIKDFQAGKFSTIEDVVARFDEKDRAKL